MTFQNVDICSVALATPDAVQQTLTPRFDVDHLLRRVDRQHDTVILPDQHLVLDPDHLIVEPFREVRQWRNVQARLDSLYKCEKVRL